MRRFVLTSADCSVTTYSPGADSQLVAQFVNSQSFGADPTSPNQIRPDSPSRDGKWRSPCHLLQSAVCFLCGLVVSDSLRPHGLYPGSSVHGISQARIPEWVAISFSRASSQPRDRIHFSWIARLTLLPRVTWEAHWTEEPGGLQAMESQRVGHNLATEEPQGPIHCWHCVKKDSEDIWAQPGEALADQERGLGAGRRMGQDPRLCRGLSPPPSWRSEATRAWHPPLPPALQLVSPAPAEGPRSGMLFFLLAP